MAIFPSSAIPSADTTFTIPYSCRFNDGSSHHLKRTMATPTSTKKFSFSFWFKRGQIAEGYYIGGHSQQNILSVGSSGSNYAEIAIGNNDYLYTHDYAGGYKLRYYRDNYRLHDTGGWMHILMAVDTTQSTAAERVRIYFNGVEQTTWNVATDPVEDSDLGWFNDDSEWTIGSQFTHTSNHFDGYLAELHYTDGTQLTPASFGETGDYGEWKPIKVSGLTYGTNGFYLDFADSADLGNDVSGESNDFTVVNLTADDQMLDSPTNNFPTIVTMSNTGLSEGNLKVTTTRTGNWDATVGSMGAGSGKWYYEAIYEHGGENFRAIAGWVAEVGRQTVSYNKLGGSGDPSSSLRNNYEYAPWLGSWYNNSSSGGTAPTITADGTDIIGLAIDIDNDKMWVAINNTWYANDGGTDGDPAGGTNQSMTLTSTYLPSSPLYVPSFRIRSDSTAGLQKITANFGQDSSFAGAKTAQGNQDGNSIGDFYYTPPSGFLALCASNLAAVAVTPSEHFNTILYTGDGNTDRGITGVGFQPDLVWIKQRATGVQDSNVYDSVRGANKKLKSNEVDAEFTDTNALMSFDADGFEVDDDAQVNDNTDTYVAWNWKGGGSAASNGDGNVTTSVSANTSAGFSIVTWTGDGSGPNTYGHGLDSAPEFVTVKRRNDTGVWYTWFNGITSNYAVFLNDTNAQQNDGNVTAVSATTITTADGVTTDSGNTFVAYCWHSVEGHSKIGFYEGNGNAHYGTYVYTGFRPKMIIVKNIDAGSDWSIVDVVRSPRNVSQQKKKLEANSNAAETDLAVNTVDMLSNGFQMRNTATDMNAANTYIYLAFAETPFKYSNAR